MPIGIEVRQGMKRRRSQRASCSADPFEMCARTIIEHSVFIEFVPWEQFETAVSIIFHMIVSAFDGDITSLQNRMSNAQEKKDE